MKQNFVLALVLLMPFPVLAETTWTGAVGGGQMIVIDGIEQSSTEKQLASTPGVMSSSNIENKTTYKSFSLGRCWNENFCVEGAYLWGAHFSTRLAVSNVGVGVVNISGSPVNFGVLPANLVFLREADVSAVQLSGLWKVPVSEYVDIFGRAGLYEYNVKTTAKILLPGTTIFLAEEKEVRDIVPMASIGGDVKIGKIIARLEGQKTGEVSLLSLFLVYKIK